MVSSTNVEYPDHYATKCGLQTTEGAWLAGPSPKSLSRQSQKQDLELTSSCD